MPENRRISFIQNEPTDSQAHFNPQDFRFRDKIARKFTGVEDEETDKNSNHTLYDLAKRMVGKLARNQDRLSGDNYETIKQEEVDEYAKDLLDFCLDLKQKHGDDKEVFVVESLFIENLYLAYNKKNEFGFEHLFSDSKLNPTFDKNNEPTKEFQNFSADVDIALKRLITGILESIKKILSSAQGEKYRASGVDEIFFAEQFPNFSNPNTPRKSRGLDGTYYVKKGRQESISRIFLEERKELFEKFEEDAKNGKLPYFIYPPKLMGKEQNSYISIENERMSNLGIMAEKALKNKEKNDEAKEKTDYVSVDQAIKAVTIFADFVKACQYIEEKGFILGDIKANNIGYDTETNQGFAFDFDAIMRPGTSYPTRLTDYAASEKYNFTANPEANIGESIHQLGQTLDMVFEPLCDATTNKELKNIFQRLIKFGEKLRKDFDRRLNKIKFDTILSELEEVVFELKSLKTH